MKYVNCPECGHKLMEGEECNNVQVKCTKCGAIIKASITASEVLIKVKDIGNGIFQSVEFREDIVIAFDSIFENDAVGDTVGIDPLIDGIGKLFE